MSPKLIFLLLHDSAAVRTVSKTSVPSPRYCLALVGGLTCQT